MFISKKCDSLKVEISLPTKLLTYIKHQVYDELCCKNNTVFILWNAKLLQYLQKTRKLLWLLCDKTTTKAMQVCNNRNCIFNGKHGSGIKRTFLALIILSVNRKCAESLSSTWLQLDDWKIRQTWKRLLIVKNSTVKFCSRHI